MITINKNNIKYLNNISKKNEIKILKYSTKSKDENLEFARMIARKEIIGGNYTFTPALHDSCRLPSADIIYYIDKGIALDDIECGVTFKSLSKSDDVIKIVDDLNNGLISAEDANCLLLDSVSKGIFKARGDFTEYIFDNSLDHERISKLDVNSGLGGSDVDRCFSPVHADRLRNFRLIEATLFDGVRVASDEFSGSELYEIKTVLKKSFSIDSIDFFSTSKVKLNLLSGDFSFDDVCKVKGRASRKRKDFEFEV